MWRGTLSASEVKVRLAEENGDLILEVHDNGKGIREDKLGTRRVAGNPGNARAGHAAGRRAYHRGPSGKRYDGEGADSGTRRT